MVLSKDKQGDGLFSKSVKIWTKGIDGEIIHSSSSSQSKPPIGHPTNLSVHVTGDGYLLIWDPPEYGLEELRIYVVRWYLGPREHFSGSAETKNTTYLSKLKKYFSNDISEFIFFVITCSTRKMLFC